jgi:2-polyprenyl-3-methyl-5-hydroxy-6-metoxy-1,4-benzoquinol methylase
MSTDTAPPTRSTAPSAEEIQDFVAGVAADQAAAIHLATVVLGDRLGLWRALAEGGPQTPDDLARRTGYQPRLVREWLRAQAVSDFAAHDPDAGTYWLTPVQRACLADEDSPAFVAGGTASVTAMHRSIDRVAEVFAGRDVLPWEEHDHTLFSGVARGFLPHYRTHLAGSWIPALDGIERRLQAGGRVADLGCGLGMTTLVIAEAYPQATVAGFDSHELSIEQARRAAADRGVADRVTFEVADAADLPGAGYDLVVIANALHEMGDPVAVCRRVRDALADGGALMLIEPVAADTDADNRTPVGRNFASASTMVCLPSAISQGGDWHLGAQAPDAEFAAVAAAAGLTRTRRVAETPLHRVLEIRP